MSAAKSVRRNYKKEVAGIIGSICQSHDGEDLTLDEIYNHVLRSNRLPTEYVEGVRDRALKKEFGRILRSATLVLSNGKTCRQFQSFTRKQLDDTEESVQLHLWKDIRQLDRHEMLQVTRERKSLLQGGIDSLSADVDFWNEHVRKPGERRIQLDLNF